MYMYIYLHLCAKLKVTQQFFTIFFLFIENNVFFKRAFQDNICSNMNENLPLQKYPI